MSASSPSSSSPSPALPHEATAEFPATTESGTWMMRSDLPHSLEREVLHRLQSCPGLKLASLEVHRIPQGVCLEGQMISNPDNLNLVEIVKSIPGITNVVNHLVDCWSGSGVWKLSKPK